MSGIKNSKDWQSSIEKLSKKQFKISIKETIMAREAQILSNLVDKILHKIGKIKKMLLKNKQNLKRKLLRIIKSAKKKPLGSLSKINTTKILIESTSKSFKTVLSYFGIRLFQIFKMLNKDFSQKRAV
jgi:hypothetical protein